MKEPRIWEHGFAPMNLASMSFCGHTFVPSTQTAAYLRVSPKADRQKTTQSGLVLERCTVVTLISMPQWPPFGPDAYPQGMPAELVALLPSLHAACVVVTSAAYEHEMFRAFGRDEAFLRKVNGTDVAPAIGVLRTCISDSLVLSLAMLFKSDPKAVNLRQLLNTVCRPEYTSFFVAAHRRCHPPLDTEHQRGRLIRMQRRINRDPLRACIQRLDDLRDQGVAHLDRAPKSDFEWPLMRDVSTAFAAAANITVSALHYMTWRRFNVRATRTHGITLTRALTQAIDPAALGTR